MALIPTKWYSSAMGGAPQQTLTAGNFISVLDACLVNGFGTVTLDSLVVASDVATLTLSTGHGFLDYQVIEIAGATPADLNGQWRFAKTSNSVGTFATSGIPDQTATGTITAKTPSLGWSKAFSDTNKAAYRMSDVISTGFYLRVDDTATNTARVVGYETMANIDTGTGPFPTDIQLSGGGYWGRGTAAGTHQWMIVGDMAAIYYSVNWSLAGTNNFQSFFYGDILTIGPPDAYRSMMVAGTAASGGTYFSYFDGGASNQYYWLARNYQANPGAVLGGTRGCYVQTSGWNTSFSYPSPIIGGLLLAWPVLVQERSGEARGTMPGMVQILNNAGSALTPGTVVANASGFASPLLLIQDKSYGNYGLVAIDMGDWR